MFVRRGLVSSLRQWTRSFMSPSGGPRHTAVVPMQRPWSLLDEDEEKLPYEERLQLMKERVQYQIENAAGMSDEERQRQLVQLGKNLQYLSQIPETEFEHEMIRDGLSPFYIRTEEMESDAGMVQHRIVLTKRTVNMTRGGRRASMSALVLVGNGNGNVGYAVGKGEEVPDAVDKAFTRAIRSMVPIERRDNHTIHHTIQHKYKRTRIYMRPAPSGYGLRAHRTVMAICDLAGIKDVGADVIGSKNPLNVVRTTFEALQLQTPWQELAMYRNKSVVVFDSPDSPPRLLLRGEKREKDDIPSSADASKITKEWIYKFPRKPDMQNLELAYTMYHAQMDLNDRLEAGLLSFEEDEDGNWKDQGLQAYVEMGKANPDVLEWLRKMPAYPFVMGTFLADEFWM